MLIPRIPLMPTDFAFEFKRVQFPVGLTPLAWTDGQFSDTRYYKYLRDLRGYLAPTISLAAYKTY